MLSFEPYSPADREFCVEIFRSNIPKYFDENETAEYSNYLDNYVSDNYWCAYDGQELVGAGGIWIRPDGIGRLVWGIIHLRQHRKGYGRQLLHFRLKKLASTPSLEIVQLDTGQHNPGFFNRFGFQEFSVKQDHYGPGLHSHEMELRLESNTRREILALT
jgi:predicted GNAT family N-acyltransferase